jgi:GxxExxY protein
MSKLIFEEESYAIIGTCIEVHKKLGNSFSEDVYNEVLEKEFTKRNIPFERHKELPIYYDKSLLTKCFTADFVCFDKIILDLKFVKNNFDKEKVQVIQYLKATQFKLGFIINFGEKSLVWKRLINT